MPKKPCNGRRQTGMQKAARSKSRRIKAPSGTKNAPPIPPPANNNSAPAPPDRLHGRQPRRIPQPPTPLTHSHSPKSLRPCRRNLKAGPRSSPLHQTARSDSSVNNALRRLYRPSARARQTVPAAPDGSGLFNAAQGKTVQPRRSRRVQQCAAWSWCAGGRPGVPGAFSRAACT